MNGHSRKFQWLLVVAIVGVMMLGQLPAFAQVRSFLLFGASFQEVDEGTEACAGQCLFPNPLTNDCTCPSGYTPVKSARILVDVGEDPNISTCGSHLWLCLK